MTRNTRTDQNCENGNTLQSTPFSLRILLDINRRLVGTRASNNHRTKHFARRIRSCVRGPLASRNHCPFQGQAPTKYTCDPGILVEVYLISATNRPREYLFWAIACYTLLHNAHCAQGSPCAIPKKHIRLYSCTLYVAYVADNGTYCR